MKNQKQSFKQQKLAKSRFCGTNFNYPVSTIFGRKLPIYPDWFCWKFRLFRRCSALCTLHASSMLISPAYYMELNFQ